MTIPSPFFIDAGAAPATTGPLIERIRAGLDAMLGGQMRLPSNRSGLNAAQQLVDTEFAVSRARGEELPLADGARFIGATVSHGVTPDVLQIYWQSGYEPYPLHRNTHVPEYAQPLGHYRGADLYGVIGPTYLERPTFAVYACTGPNIDAVRISTDEAVIEGDPMTISLLTEAWRRLDVLAQGPQA